MSNFQEWLKNNQSVVKKFEGLTRTAQEAADQIGCSVAQIAKSIIFKSAEGEAVLVIASGTSRISEDVISSYLGHKIGKADADFVYQETGFVIGGVPPFGHKKKLKTFIDKDLNQFEEVWASAGSSNSVFLTNFVTLKENSQAHEVPVA